MDYEKFEIICTNTNLENFVVMIIEVTAAIAFKAVLNIVTAHYLTLKAKL